MIKRKKGGVEDPYVIAIIVLAILVSIVLIYYAITSGAVNGMVDKIINRIKFWG